MHFIFANIKYSENYYCCWIISGTFRTEFMEFKNSKCIFNPILPLPNLLNINDKLRSY